MLNRTSLPHIGHALVDAVLALEQVRPVIEKGGIGVAVGEGGESYRGGEGRQQGGELGGGVVDARRALRLSKDLNVDGEHVKDKVGRVCERVSV